MDFSIQSNCLSTIAADTPKWSSKEFSLIYHPDFLKWLLRDSSKEIDLTQAPKGQIQRANWQVGNTMQLEPKVELIRHKSLSRHGSDYSNESNSTLLTLCPLIHIKVALICWFLEGNIFLNAKHGTRTIIIVAGRIDASSMNSSETLL